MEINEDIFKANQVVQQTVKKFSDYVIRFWPKHGYTKDELIKHHLDFFKNKIDFTGESFIAIPEPVEPVDHVEPVEPLEPVEPMDTTEPNVKGFNDYSERHQRTLAKNFRLTAPSHEVLYCAAEQALRIDHDSNAAADVLSLIKNDKELAYKVKDWINTPETTRPRVEALDALGLIMERNFSVKDYQVHLFIHKS